MLVLLSWVLFRSETIGDAFDFFGAMFGTSATNPASSLLAGELYTRGHVLVMGICAVFAFQRMQSFDWVAEITWSKAWLLLGLLALSLSQLFAQAFNPFLYFQF